MQSQTIKKILIYFFNNLDRIVSGILIFIGIGIIFLSLIGRINQVFIGYALLTAPLIYLIFKSRLKMEISKDHGLSFRKILSLNIIFWILLFIAEIIWMNQLYSRPLIYFILISLLSIIIGFEILFYNKNNSPLPILFKIFILAFVERTGIYFNYPSIMGYDSFIHTKVADLISTTGLIPPSDVSFQYANYPILHIFIAANKLVSFTDIKYAVLLSIGLASILVVGLFVFLIVKHLAGPRIGLTAALLILLTPQMINMGLTSITAGSLVLCYFLVLLFIIILKEKLTFTFLLLQYFITFMMIITHQLSTFVVLLILCILYSAGFLYEYLFSTKPANFKFLYYLFFFGITMLTYWIHTLASQDISFFNFVLTPLIDVIKHGGQYGSDRLIVGPAYVRPVIETIVLQGSYLILPFFGIGGLLYWLSIKNKIKFSIAAITSILFFLMYAIPFLGIRNLLTDRWAPFLYLFLGILTAVYIISILDRIKSNKRKIALFFIFLFTFSFLMITLPMINKDNPLIAKNTSVRNQYTYNEITACKWLGSYYSSIIVDDSSFSNAVFFYGSDDTIEGTIQLKNALKDFRSLDDLMYPNIGSLTVLRKSTITEPTSLSALELYSDRSSTPLPKSIFEYFEQSEKQNAVYSNGYIDGYYTR